MIDEMTFGQWLQIYRAVHNVSFEELAQFLGYSAPYLARVEESSKLGLQLARVILELLPLSPDERHTFRVICRMVLLPVELDRLFSVGLLATVPVRPEPVAPSPKTSPTSDKCFVIMPFAPPIGTYYSPIIARAITLAKLRPERGDDNPISAAIYEQIREAIINAAVCIADVTGQNANVMYELGLAHALRKPVVVITQDMKHVPFDIRHIRCITYDTTGVKWQALLRSRIRTTLLATINDPQGAAPFRES